MSDGLVNIANLRIVGQNHYFGNITSLFPAGFAQEFATDGILEPEPTNSHDPSAVILRIRGYVVGYIAQENASTVKSQIGTGVKVRCKLIWIRDPQDPIISVVITSID